MKQKKTHQLRIRITENQLSSIVQYIVDHPNEFKNQSDLIRESIKSRISRTTDISSKTKNNG
jgi:Arc/MetJ-type ribon-helix-helix transcriptional regulator